MTVGFSDLWRLDGTVERGPYALLGVAGFAIKHNLDRLVATLVFHRPWGLFNYLVPLSRGDGVLSVGPGESALFATLLALALPFIWTGVALTLRRLRSVGLPTGLVVIFFLPVVNLLFFLVLSLLPSRPRAQESFGSPRVSFLDRLIPDHALGSAALALMMTVPLGAAAVALGVSYLGQYGWSVFVALPFTLGLASVLLYGYHRPRGFWSCLGVSLVALALLSAVLVATAIEGAVCLLMAAPLGLALAGVGGAVGYAIQRRAGRPWEARRVLGSLAIALPILMGAEHADPDASPLLSVRTAVDIDAPTAEVWRRVVSFTEIPEPREWLFRIGFAYPRRATIDGRGVGAVRRCVFSTGSFVEPIEAWEEPRLLRFSVREQPAPMQEWTPYPSLHPAHLDDYLRSEGGQFLLVPIGPGRTHLEGTTWYRHRVWPAPYWRLWSDFVIHRIHTRVLQHIKKTAEGATLPASPRPGA